LLGSPSELEIFLTPQLLVLPQLLIGLPLPLPLPASDLFPASLPAWLSPAALAAALRSRFYESVLARVTR
jgi:hypothetical protein